MTEDKKKLVEVFLIKLGEKIKYKREIKGLKQEALASYLEVDKSNISRYEAGCVDFPVSKLPLISKYCDFPLKDYFDEELQQTISQTVKEMARLVQTKYKTKDARKAHRDAKKEAQMEFLVGFVYEKDGVRYTKDKIGSDVVQPKPMSDYEICMRGDYYTNSNVVPFNEQDFMVYLEGEPLLLEILQTGRKMIDCMGNDTKETRLKTSISEYVIGEVFIEKVLKQESWDALRAYAYYKKMMGKL